MHGLSITISNVETAQEEAERRPEGRSADVVRRTIF
jgi:hypothetical protein